MAKEKPRRVKIVISAVIPADSNGKRIPQREIKEVVADRLAEFQPKAIRIDEMSSVPQKAKAVAQRVVSAGKKAASRVRS